MIRSGDFIKHEKFMDVCLLVTDAFDYGHGVKVKGTWWNLGQNTSYPIGIKAVINIAKKEADIKPQSGRRTHIKQWGILAPECRTDACYRYSRWL